MHGNRVILLVEDDTIDVMTIKRAIKQVGIDNPLQVAANGEEALAYLQELTHELPALVLLDINMPRMNGIEFLSAIKADARLRTLPVIMLTTSRQEQDKVASFNLSVAGYMVKPVNYDQFVEMVRSIDAYWSISELP